MFKTYRAGRIGRTTLMAALLCLGVLGSAVVSHAADRTVVGELFTATW